jgi:hypothetical protein
MWAEVNGEKKKVAWYVTPSFPILMLPPSFALCFYNHPHRLPPTSSHCTIGCKLAQHPSCVRANGHVAAPVSEVTVPRNATIAIGCS